MINLSVLGANPYIQNHHLRLIGVVLTFSSIIISNFFLVYFEASSSSVTSSWGIFFVQPVTEWKTWWHPAQETICEIANNSTLLEGYQWKEAYKTAFTGVNASTLCNSVFKLMIVALVTGFVMIACSCGIVVSCTVIIIFCASGFMAVFNLAKDRALLSTKFEFERLDWRQVDDTKEAYRKLMQYDMERLEAAKFGGLMSPQDVARRTLDENLEGHDRFVLQHLNPW
uniref:Uncharacterized protein n=1 Tax=Neospora caninum (strain Liverpool) TaxID=572307 RepID=F0JB75_NEOCL|nr:hypothetical protein, conserved [Neospora caninum Liverpool]CEL71342.1 TPA: hypothetical protein, conserved [Neospora caninum Liverpool]